MDSRISPDRNAASNHTPIVSERITLSNLDNRFGGFCEEVLALERADARQFAPILERLIGDLDNLHGALKRQWQRDRDKLAKLESLQGGNG